MYPGKLNNLRFLDEQREQVGLHVLSQAAKLGDRNPSCLGPYLRGSMAVTTTAAESSEEATVAS